MIGVVSSYDSQRRCGYIKETDKNSLYYFSKSSVLDNSMMLEVGKSVMFELYHVNDNQTVAVRITAYNTQRDDTNWTGCSGGYVNAAVLWFSPEKKYGYVRCCTDPPQEAFLHQRLLSKVGLRSVQHGQRLRVKLVIDKYPGKPSVSDVMLPNSGPVNFEQNSSGDSHSNARENYANKLNRPVYEQSLPKHPNHIKPRLNAPKHKPPASTDYVAIPNAPSSQQLRPINPGKRNDMWTPSHAPSTNQDRDESRQRLLQQSTLTKHFQPRSEEKAKLSSHTSTYTDPESDKINQQIFKKRGLLKTLDVSKLPDGGRRLRDQVAELELKLQKLQFNQDRIKMNPEKASTPQTALNDVVDLTKDSHEYGFDLSLYRQESSQSPLGDHYYGGRMTTKRLMTARKVTGEAIEKLHTSLDTCPPSSAELEDPDGLLVELMCHQRQALAWLVWRERQAVNGGILADDMGLGKTLTMISLILKQMQAEEAVDQVESSSTANSDGDVKSTHSDDNSAGEVIDGSVNDEIKHDKTNGDNEDLISCNSTLIVAPASLVYHWENEIRNRCRKGLLSIHLYHGPSRERDAEKLSEFDVVVTTYDIVRRGKPDKAVDSKAGNTTKAKGNEDALFAIKWRRIILDEAHQIRNYKSQTSGAACMLKAQSRWAMSGTPVQNQETDMYAMIKYLHCHPFDEYKLWKNQVSNKTDRGQQRLKTLVSSLVLRREKSQKGLDGKPLVSLPTRSFTTHKLKLSEFEQEVYNKLKSDSQAAYKKYERTKDDKGSGPYDKQELKCIDTSDKKMSATTLLVMLLRLRQCCGHLSLLKNTLDAELFEKEKQEIAVEDLFQSLSLGAGIGEDTSGMVNKYGGKDKAKFFDISSSSSKINFVMETLQRLKLEKPNDKCVIVSQWTSMLRVLAHHLEASKFSYAIIEGSVPARKRMDLVDDFNRNPVKPKIMLVSLQAGGVGLNLIGGNHLFMIDMHWNPALERQAFDRIYRVGQKKDVFVHKFVISDSVEEQILKLQERKLAMAKAVMEGADTDSKVKLILADMKALFGI